MIFWIYFAIWTLIGIVSGVMVWRYLSNKDKDTLGFILYFVIMILFVSIGLMSGQIIFEEELEIEAREYECEETCDSKGLEFVGVENQECFCKEPEFTLVNGGSNG